MHPAAYWCQDRDMVQCLLCPHGCRIAVGKLGRCGIRRNRDGQLVAEAYGLISSLALDPIEKKPLFHVYPGSGILSIGSAGCNFRCSFCQNWTISQQMPPLSRLEPEALAREAAAQGACGVAYTYNEPLINFEYIQDCARRIQAEGMINVVVTNGYINPEPLQELAPLIDAWNIDVKAIRPDFYREFCGARLEPVLETVRLLAPVAHVELTHLLVTEGNDHEEEVEELVDWVASVSPEIPLHLSRYFPQYRWYAPPTDLEFMQRAYAIARKKLTWVYVGNVGISDDSTYCPNCHALLIARHGYHVEAVRVRQNACPQCGRHVPGIFEA